MEPISRTIEASVKLFLESQLALAHKADPNQLNYISELKALVPRIFPSVLSSLSLLNLLPQEAEESAALRTV